MILTSFSVTAHKPITIFKGYRLTGKLRSIDLLRFVDVETIHGYSTGNIIWNSTRLLNFLLFK